MWSANAQMFIVKGSPLNAKATLLWFGLKAAWENLYVSQKKNIPSFPAGKFPCRGYTPLFPHYKSFFPEQQNKRNNKIIHLAFGKLKLVFNLNNLFLVFRSSQHNPLDDLPVGFLLKIKRDITSLYISPKIGPLFNI